MLMNVSHAGLALVYVLLELRKKLNHHKKKRTKLPLSGSFLFVPIRNHYYRYLPHINPSHGVVKARCLMLVCKSYPCSREQPERGQSYFYLYFVKMAATIGRQRLTVTQFSNFPPQIPR